MTLHCSLNEIEATARKAARGAGYDWGLAEEAGKAARWLSARGLPGVGPLLAILQRNDGRPYRDLRPRIEGDAWHPSTDRLCPLVAGAALSDRFEALAAGRRIRLLSASHPILLLPFLGRACTATGVPVALSWPGMKILIRKDGPCLDGHDEALEPPDPVCAIVAPAQAAADLPPRAVCLQGVAQDARTWRRLEAFAARTYVPDSEESRLTGAGAGLSDND